MPREVGPGQNKDFGIFWNSHVEDMIKHDVGGWRKAKKNPKVAALGK